jgi:hypothetical protein
MYQGKRRKQERKWAGTQQPCRRPAAQKGIVKGLGINVPALFSRVAAAEHGHGHH